MFSGGSPLPKVVKIRVLRAENLSISYKQDGKHKKMSQKWKVTVHGGKKKVSTEGIHSPYGNPTWNCDLKVKIPREPEPLCLLVTNGDDYHAGQVVIPINIIPPAPGNPQESSTDRSRILVNELEATRKTTNPTGKLYYWVWVEEYRLEDDGSKHKKGSSKSVLSLTSKHKRRNSNTDALTYSGSMLGVNSSHTDLREGRKRSGLFHRRSVRDVLKSAADLSQQPKFGTRGSNDSIRQSYLGSSIYDPTSRTNKDRRTDDHNGSILGATSDLNMETGQNNRMNFTRVAPTPPTFLPVNPPTVQDTVKPQLLRLEPRSCSTAGGVQVTVFATGLSDDITRFASILVDGHSVPTENWHIQPDPEKAGHYQLKIRMPERPSGRYSIEMETLNHGRLRCPEEFLYTNEQAQSQPASIQSSDDEGRSPLSQNSMDSPIVSPFVRAGSVRSSKFQIRDSRRSRRERPTDEQSNLSSPVIVAPASAIASEKPSVPLTTPMEADSSASKEAGSDKVESVHDDDDVDMTKSSPFVRAGSMRRSNMQIRDSRRTRRGRPTTEASDISSALKTPLGDTNMADNFSLVSPSLAKTSVPTSSINQQISSLETGSQDNSNVAPFGGLSRSGSTRSSMIIRDRRSLRRPRNSESVLPNMPSRQPHECKPTSNDSEDSEQPPKEHVTSGHSPILHGNSQFDNHRSSNRDNPPRDGTNDATGNSREINGTMALSVSAPEAATIAESSIHIEETSSASPRMNLDEREAVYGQSKETSGNFDENAGIPLLSVAPEAPVEYSTAEVLMSPTLPKTETGFEHVNITEQKEEIVPTIQERLQLDESTVPSIFEGREDDVTVIAQVPTVDMDTVVQPHSTIGQREPTNSSMSVSPFTYGRPQVDEKHQSHKEQQAIRDELSATKPDQITVPLSLKDPNLPGEQPTPMTPVINQNADHLVSPISRAHAKTILPSSGGEEQGIDRVESKMEQSASLSVAAVEELSKVHPRDNLEVEFEEMVRSNEIALTQKIFSPMATAQTQMLSDEKANEDSCSVPAQNSEVVDMHSGQDFETTPSFVFKSATEKEEPQTHEVSHNYVDLIIGDSVELLAADGEQGSSDLRTTAEESAKMKEVKDDVDNPSPPVGPALSPHLELNALRMNGSSEPKAEEIRNSLGISQESDVAINNQPPGSVNRDVIGKEISSAVGHPLPDTVNELSGPEPLLSISHTLYEKDLHKADNALLDAAGLRNSPREPSDTDISATKQLDRASLDQAERDGCVPLIEVGYSADSRAETSPSADVFDNNNDYQGIHSQYKPLPSASPVFSRISSNRSASGLSQTSSPDDNSATLPNLARDDATLEVNPDSEDDDTKSSATDSWRAEGATPYVPRSPYNPIGDIQTTQSPTKSESPTKGPAAPHISVSPPAWNQTTRLSYAMFESSEDDDEDHLSEDDEYPMHDHASHRSAASGQSKNTVDESKMENEGLRSMLEQANRFIEALKVQTIELEKQLSERNADVERLSSELCSLRNQLLRDGLLKYLEKKGLRSYY